jgi:hypothetical protein
MSVVVSKNWLIIQLEVEFLLTLLINAEKQEAM